mmetsp:Transcript_135292/g.337556  ORF Transcript_135292/g.337556 Transcript_135292/m.337556 type:complete len:278 (+) Transcript_135292:1328-2161(+)
MPSAESRIVLTTFTVWWDCISTKTSPFSLVTPGSAPNASNVWMISWSELRAFWFEPMIRMTSALGAQTFMSSFLSIGLPSRYEMSFALMPSKRKCMRTSCLMSTAGLSARMTTSLRRLRHSRVGHWRQQRRRGSVAFSSSASSSVIKSNVFSLQPSTRMWLFADTRLYISLHSLSTLRTTSTTVPSNVKLKTKPQTENVTATILTLAGSDAGKPVCVPGSKNNPQLIQKLSLSEELYSSFPPTQDQQKVHNANMRPPIDIKPNQWPSFVPKTQSRAS